MSAGENEAGGLFRCPWLGCGKKPQLLAASVQPRSLTTDDSAIYWATAQGSLHKIAMFPSESGSDGKRST